MRVALRTRLLAANMVISISERKGDELFLLAGYVPLPQRLTMPIKRRIHDDDEDDDFDEEGSDSSRFSESEDEEEEKEEENDDEEEDDVPAAIGDVGYQFSKQFSSGWFTGTVSAIVKFSDGKFVCLFSSNERRLNFVRHLPPTNLPST